MRNIKKILSTFLLGACSIAFTSCNPSNTDTDYQKIMNKISGTVDTGTNTTVTKENNNIVVKYSYDIYKSTVKIVVDSNNSGSHSGSYIKDGESTYTFTAFTANHKYTGISKIDGADDSLLGLINAGANAALTNAYKTFKNTGYLF